MFDFYITIANPDIGPQLKQIKERLQTMPTNDELTVKLQAVEDALTTEIQQITDALAASGVSQENLDKLDALKNRISGIIADQKP